MATRQCPKCGKTIFDSDANAEAELALCRQCEGVVPLEDATEAEAFERVDFSEPPAGVTINDAGHRLTITVSPTRWHVIPVLPFAALWNGFIWFVVGLLVRDYVAGEMNISDAGALGVAAFLLPFVAIGLGFAYATLFLLFGKVRVTLDRDVLKVTKGVFGIGRTKKVAWHEVADVHFRKDPDVDRNVRRIDVEGPKPIKFCSGYREDRTRFVAAVLQRMLEERDDEADRPVRAAGLLIPVVCPKCLQPIPSKSVNMTEAMARCDACGELWSLAEVVAAGKLASVDLARPPHGVHVSESGSELRLVARRYSHFGWFITFFAVGWNAIVSVFLSFIVPSAIRGEPAFDNPPFPGFGVVFITPFVIVGIIVAWVALWNLLGKVTVTVDNHEVRVQSGITPLARTRRRRRDQITGVGISDKRHLTKFNPGETIVIGGTEPLVFASDLSEERRLYAAAALRRRLVGDRQGTLQ